MEANIVFPLLLTALGIIFGICLRLSIAIVRILIYVNTDSGQYEHPAFPALGSVLF